MRSNRRVQFQSVKILRAHYCQRWQWALRPCGEAPEPSSYWGLRAYPCRDLLLALPSSFPAPASPSSFPAHPSSLPPAALLVNHSDVAVAPSALLLPPSSFRAPPNSSQLPALLPPPSSFPAPLARSGSWPFKPASVLVSWRVGVLGPFGGPSGASCGRHWCASLGIEIAAHRQCRLLFCLSFIFSCLF